MYARDGDDIVVVPGRPRLKTWWRNLRRPAKVRVRVAGQEVEATARAIDGAVDPEEVAPGLLPWLRRFPRAARALEIRPTGEGFDGTDLRRLAEGSVVVRIQGASSAGSVGR